MKRALTLMITIAMVLSCVISCYAATYNDKRSGDVYAKNKRMFGKPNYYTTGYANDGYSIKTDRDINIKVTSENKGLLLVVHEVVPSETTAYQWFDNSVKTQMSFSAYDIYFLDSNSRRIELSNANTLRFSDNKKAHYVSFLSYDGKLSLVSRCDENRVVEFSALSEHGYYLLIEQSDILGDVDGDGIITIFDATVIQYWLASIKISFSDEDLMRGDSDGDGWLDIIDVLWIQRYIAHMNVPYQIGHSIE